MFLFSYRQDLTQCLEHYWCSVHICWVDEWMDRWMDCREDEHSVDLRKLATSLWAIPFSDHAILSDPKWGWLLGKDIRNRPFSYPPLWLLCAIGCQVQGPGFKTGLQPFLRNPDFITWNTVNAEAPGPVIPELHRPALLLVGLSLDKPASGLEPRPEK